MARPKSRNLTEAELRLMNILWKIGPATVGQVADYGCVGTCDVPNRIALPARHLILKDTQIRSDGIMQAPLRSDFCGLPGWSTAAAMTPGAGNCEGVDESAAEEAASAAT